MIIISKTYNRPTEVGGKEEEDEDNEYDMDEVEDDREEDVGNCIGCKPFGVNFCNDRWLELGWFIKSMKLAFLSLSLLVALLS